MKVSPWKALEAELQHVADKYIALSAVCERNIDSEREASSEERKQLLARIFSTQEQLATTVLLQERTKADLTAALSYIQRLYIHHPKLSHGVDAQVSVIPDGDAGGNTLSWCLKEIYLGGQYFAEVNFRTVLQGTMAGVVFMRHPQSAESNPLTRWPLPISDHDEISLIPVAGSLNTGTNEILTSLGSTDWRTLNSLVSALICWMASTSGVLPSETASAYATGFDNLQRALNNWPSVLRFDRVSLADVRNRAGYSGLEIRLENVSQGERYSSSVNYCVGTVDGPLGEFGYHPRLEIPVSYAGFLNSGSPVASTKPKECFELRFSLPDDMDVPTWQKLSEADKVCLAALISSMPSQFEQLRASMAIQDWDKWTTLCQSIRRIFSERLYHRVPKVK
jgi:hypothetical protein